MLKVTNLLKNFQNEERNVLNNVTFEASRGELIAIIGKSGSGKTTLMNIIAGLEKPSAGFVFFDGEELTTYKEDEYSIFRNENIGIVFQEFNLIEELNVIDNVILPLTLISPNNKENKKQGMQLLKKFRIDNICKRLAKNLSGGEKAKVGISRAMINNPDMVLCDEPTGSLDSENAVIVFQTLKQISKDKLVIVVTHDDALIEEYATRLIRIHDGKIISDETRQPNIRKESTKTYRRNLKKENPAATSKLILSHLANRKNKFSLTITSLSFSFLFMLLTFMFLFGFRYNINRSLNEISNPNEYIGIKYNYTEINEADRQYITQNFDVKEVFLKEVYRNTLSNESATFDTTIENIPEDQDDFNFKKRLIGSHPNTQNQVLVSKNIAEQLVGEELTLKEMIEELKTQTFVIRIGEDILKTVQVSGIVDVEYSDDELHIYIPNTTLSSWQEEAQPTNIVNLNNELIIIINNTKNIKTIQNELLENRDIVLEKSTRAVEDELHIQYSFVSTALLTVSIASFGLAAATLYIQINSSIRSQQKKVAILYSLGATKISIHKIFVYEMEIVCLASFIVASVLASMFAVLFDLALSSELINVLQTYQNITISPIRILANSWFIYMFFLVLMFSLTFIGTNLLASKKRSASISETLKKD